MQEAPQSGGTTKELTGEEEETAREAGSRWYDEDRRLDKRLTRLGIKDSTEEELSTERAVVHFGEKWGQNGTKEKLENGKPFHYCCYCPAENCLVKLDFSENGYYVSRLRWDVSEQQRGRRGEDVKRTGGEEGEECLSLDPQVISILCVADCGRGAPQAAGGPLRVLPGGGQLPVRHHGATCRPLGAFITV